MAPGTKLWVLADRRHGARRCPRQSQGRGPHPEIYDPTLNPLYRDVLAHYGAVALPCRVGDPDRKGKVEAGVGHAKKTPLRGLRFESLADAQASRRDRSRMLRIISADARDLRARDARGALLFAVPGHDVTSYDYLRSSADGRRR